MPPRRRAQFTQENVEQQLQQIHLLDPQSSSENLEQLGPIIKQIHQNRQQDAYLRAVQGLVDSKDAEIERICGDNYQDFLSSLQTLTTIKTYTSDLRDTITRLDASVAQTGRGVVEKKRALLQSKRTAGNLDSAIDTLQACLRLLDVVARVGAMIQEGKYWSALRSLEEVQSMPATSLSQTPLFQHLLSSLPSLRVQIKDAVAASTKQWLFDVRNASEQVGQYALDAMNARARKWKSRRERDPMLKHRGVGSAVEAVTFERADVNVLDNEEVKVDFKPLYQSIHIYTALDALDEIRKSYQADRRTQSELILQSISANALAPLIHKTAGFFLIEREVLQSTGDFRSAREVDELWDDVVARLTSGLNAALRNEVDPDSLLSVKELILSFIVTVESFSYSTKALHEFILYLFDSYVRLLEKQFGRHLSDIVTKDDYQPMHVETPEERDAVLRTVWIPQIVEEELSQAAFPLNFPWSQSFYQCCQSIDTFTQKFLQYVEGVHKGHRNVDEQLGKSLDELLSNSIGRSIGQRLEVTSGLQQIGQIVMNLEHFQSACSELERSITEMRAAQRGNPVQVPNATYEFGALLTRALSRLTRVIASKLDEFFELSEYEWTPAQREQAPSMYLYELVNWLTTVVDSLPIKESHKDEAYRGAVAYIAECLTDFLVGKHIPAINENALSNVLVDIDFLEQELSRIQRGHLTSTFAELHALASIVLGDTVQDYLVPAVRQTSYPAVIPRHLRSVLEKLAKYGASCRDAPSRDKGERRRKEAEAVGRIFPGENR